MATPANIPDETPQEYRARHVTMADQIIAAAQAAGRPCGMVETWRAEFLRGRQTWRMGELLRREFDALPE